MIDVLGKVRDSGVTIVIVEHVMAVIMSLCDSIVVINHGENMPLEHLMKFPTTPRFWKPILAVTSKIQTDTQRDNQC